MHYKVFGRKTGLRVSELALGAGNFGTGWGHGAERDASPTHVAIAWLREKARRSTTALIPILGSRTREQLDATLGALQVQLSLEQVARLDGSSEVAKGVSHESIAGSVARFSGDQVLDQPVIPVT